ncbi:alpha/beta fold hydrolase [Thioclava sp. GXIMD4215]|uniref:alpha/beta fold hydrolase n=1 Tax=Thioclava sp. GXIMD4215 TaxID=3131928 RepID=UPI0032480460
MIDDRRGVQIASELLGGGERPALAIHCMLGNARAWEPSFALLEDRMTARVFDLPGHGRSGEWVAEEAAGAFERLVTQIAASFIDRPLDLIGHSFGSSVALRLAVAAPEAIRSLTLIEPILFAAIEGTPEYDAVAKDQKHLMQLLAAGKREEAARAFLAQWGSGVPWEALPEHQRARFMEQMPILANTTTANFADPGQILRADGIEAIDAPVLLVHGDQTHPSVPLVCAELAVRMQNVGTATVPGAGHMLPLTHFESLADLIGVNLDRS